MARGRKNLKKRGPKVRRKQKNHSRFIKGTHTDEYVKVRRALAISADCRALLRLVACCVLLVACCVLCVVCCVSVGASERARLVMLAQWWQRVAVVWDVALRAAWCDS